MIPLARPWLGDEEAEAARAVLATGMLVQGPRVEAFERELAEVCGRRHAVACSSGTAALELALAALEIRDGSVLCPALSWPSPAHAIARANAQLALVDVERDTWNASAAALAAARRPDTRAAIVIDQFGNPADHVAIAKALPDLPTIVDAACSIGATLHDRPSATFGTIACLSFHPRKLITTSEGGACLTDDPRIADRLRVFRNHGQRAPGDFVTPAGNQRLTEIAAAIGSVQLTRLDAIVARRRAIAARYDAALRGRVGLPSPSPGGRPNFQTYGILVGAERRDTIVGALGEAGVQAGRLSYALHHIGSFSGLGDDARFPCASAIEASGLAIPIFGTMTDDEVERVIAALLVALDRTDLDRRQDG
ncbi:MAG: DegT/DnrJ/EryC1/StrS family aminotransferase [Sandaracinaceae bacterium]